jgi:Glycosyl hydrolase family 12
MAAHRKPRKLVPLAAVLCVLAATAVGGYALAGSRAPGTVNLASTSRASGRDGTAYACLASGKLTRVSMAAAPKCPAKSALLHWAAQSGPASSPGQPISPSPSASLPPSSPPSSVPTTTSPSPVRTTTSPPPTQASTSPVSWAWCSSAPFGEWTTPDGRFDLYNNEWNTSDNPGPQTICGNSESDWQVTSTQRAGNTGVLTYPSVQLNYNGGNGYPLSKFTSMTSSYAETMNAVNGTDAEAAYDIWLDGLNKEVMVWVDNHGQTPAGSKVATTTFSGATWDLYETSDRSYMALVREGNATSGTVDLLAALNYLEGRGDLAAGDTLWQVNFGWEICSTAGAPETFTVSNYSLTSTPSS